MLGGIYTDEQCGVCGEPMKDNGRNSLCCPEHRNQIAKRLRVVLKWRGEWVKQRFTSYDEASRFLNGVRFKIDEGSFDPRDYRADNPLGFENLVVKWLVLKKSQIKPKSWNNLNNYMRLAIVEWGNRSVKDIGYGEIEDFLFKTLVTHSTKSRANARSTINSFFDWLRRRRVLQQVPEIPEVPFELEFRKTLDRPTQDAVMEELQRISRNVNPRIWIAVKWLATYFSIRHGELIRIREGEIDRDNGFLIIPHPKEKKPKVVPLIDEDLELVRSLPRAFPDLPFFRHFKGFGGCKPGEQFGSRYLWKWSKKACENLGVEGVDLYGGTRHSTVIHLGQFFTPEELKAASFHSTNKAFERYFRVKPEAIKNIYGYDRKSLEKGGKQRGNKMDPFDTREPA